MSQRTDQTRSNLVQNQEFANDKKEESTMLKVNNLRNDENSLFSQTEQSKQTELHIAGGNSQISTDQTDHQIVQTSQEKSESPIFTNQQQQESGNDLKKELSIEKNFDLSQIELHQGETKNQQSVLLENLTEKVDKKTKTMNPGNNLSFAIANRYPPTIKNQVFKMIQYYENTIAAQDKAYRQLTQQNKNLKRKEILALELSSSLRRQKYNLANQENISQNTIQFNTIQSQRVSDLEDKLLTKDKEIIKLNAQIRQLYAKLKKKSNRSSKSALKQTLNTQYDQQ